MLDPTPDPTLVRRYTQHIDDEEASKKGRPIAIGSNSKMDLDDDDGVAFTFGRHGGAYAHATLAWKMPPVG